ncbi:MAG TPA: hypothetical protein VF193_01690 [Steroidobacter sp.]
MKRAVFCVPGGVLAPAGCPALCPEGIGLRASSGNRAGPALGPSQ